MTRSARGPSGTVLPWLGLAGLGGAAFGVPGLTGDLLAIDLVYGIIIAAWALRLLRRDSAPLGTYQRFVVPLGIIFFGSLLGATNTGLSPTTSFTLVQDVASLATFLAMLDLVERNRRLFSRAAPWIMAGMVAAVAGHMVFVQTAERPAATFENPNLAAHVIATAMVGALVLRLPRWAKAITVVLGTLGIIASGSFGALLQLTASGVVAVGLYLGNRGIRLTAWAGAAAAIAVVALGVVAFLPDVAPAISGDRLSRSSATRFELWSGVADVAIHHPLGIGPGNTEELAVLPSGQEAHSDYLAYLIERSAVGLLGLVMLWVTLMKIGPKTAVVAAGIAASGLVREVMHFRHVWMILGVVVVLDLLYGLQADPDDTSPISTLVTA